MNDEFAGLDDQDVFGSYCYWNRVVQKHYGYGDAVVYAQEEDELKLADRVELNDTARQLVLARTALTNDDLQQFDGCFLTPSIVRKLASADRQRIRIRPRDSDSLVGFLAWIENECRRNKWDNVVAVPVGNEDEGQYLLDWVNGTARPRRLTILFLDALDFADLRGWQ